MPARGFGFHCRRLVDTRKVNFHRGAAIGHAVHVQIPAALLDDAEHRGEPQPRTPAGSLGGEEGLLTMPNTVESPNPVPRPEALVVKKGSNKRAWVASSIPPPLSLTAICT